MHMLQNIAICINPDHVIRGYDTNCINTSLNEIITEVKSLVSEYKIEAQNKSQTAIFEDMIFKGKEREKSMEVEITSGRETAEVQSIKIVKLEKAILFGEQQLKTLIDDQMENADLWEKRELHLEESIRKLETETSCFKASHCSGRKARSQFERHGWFIESFGC